MSRTPPDNPDHDPLVAPAIRLANGAVYRAPATPQPLPGEAKDLPPIHMDAMHEAVRQGAPKAAIERALLHPDGTGFVTRSGKYLTRREAAPVAVRLGQLRKQVQHKADNLLQEWKDNLESSLDSYDIDFAKSRRRSASSSPAPFVGTGFHASPHDFDAFDRARIGARDDGDLGQGAYVSTDPAVGGRNATYTHEFSVTLKNPLRLALPSWKEDKRQLIRATLNLPENAPGHAINTALTARGHDGVILDYTPAGYAHQEIMMLDHEQPKKVRTLYGPQGVWASTAKSIVWGELLEELAKAVPLQRDLLDADVGYASEGHDTPEFRSWFGNSVVRHADGRPRAVYHGTMAPTDFVRMRGNKLNISPIDQRLGPHFAVDPKVANRFSGVDEVKAVQRPNDPRRPRVLPVFLSIQKPRIISLPGTASAKMVDAGRFGQDIAQIILPHRPELMHELRRMDWFAKMPSYDEAMANEPRRQEVMRDLMSRSGTIKPFDASAALRGTFLDSALVRNLRLRSQNDKSLRREYRARLREMGHDGWAYENSNTSETDGAISNTAFVPMHPSQIKSVFNTRPTRSSKVHE